MSVRDEFWFARRYPLGAMRGGMAPIGWQGWALRAAFLLALAASALFGVWIAEHGDAGRGVAAFGIFGFGAWLGYTRVVNLKGDHLHTVADHRSEKADA